MLIWSPKGEQQCRYILQKKMEGVAHGNRWVSSDGQWLISVGRESKRVSDCGNELIVSNEGLAILKEEMGEHSNGTIRGKREVDASSDYGVVLTPQLASQGSAVAYNAHESVKKYVDMKFAEVCRDMDVMVKQLGILAATEPTLAARVMLGKYALHARAIGTEYLVAWPCMLLEENEIDFWPWDDGDHCREYPRARVKKEIFGVDAHSYMDPKTNIVVSHSRKMDCSTVRTLEMEVYGKLWEVDQMQGKLRQLDKNEVKNISIYGLEHHNEELKLTLLQNTVVSGQRYVSFDEHAEALRINEEIRTGHIGVEKRQSGRGVVAEIVYSQLAYWVGDWTAFEIWTAVSNVVVLVWLLKKWLWIMIKCSAMGIAKFVVWITVDVIVARVRQRMRRGNSLEGDAEEGNRKTRKNGEGGHYDASASFSKKKPAGSLGEGAKFRVEKGNKRTTVHLDDIHDSDAEEELPTTSQEDKHHTCGETCSHQKHG
jgi:hypothetical protein